MLGKRLETLGLLGGELAFVYQPGDVENDLDGCRLRRSLNPEEFCAAPSTEMCRRSVNEIERRHQIYHVNSVKTWRQRWMQTALS
jgi:hypothetical protein